MKALLAFLMISMMSVPAVAETGIASYYGKGHHGKRTASGMIFNMHGFSAAHRSHKFGTILLVTNIRNGKSVKVIITDRGPAKRTGRVIDLSLGAAQVLQMQRAGTALVRIER